MDTIHKNETSNKVNHVRILNERTKQLDHIPVAVNFDPDFASSWAMLIEAMEGTIGMQGGESARWLGGMSGLVGGEEETPS